MSNGIPTFTCVQDAKSISLFEGDCIEVMQSMDANTMDAVVCDPPYNLAFMNRKWDTYQSATQFQKWCSNWGKEALRVLKPGGYILSFGGTRSYHRLTSGLEDAGFEIKDSLMWIYGSGFPKSLNVSKAIDKVAVEAKGISSETQRYNGFGTALKPAFEPIVMGRKPLQEKSIVKNILTWGTGGLNIDACRIDYQSTQDRKNVWPKGKITTKANGAGATPDAGRNLERIDLGPLKQSFGRWPANVILSHASECKMVGTEEDPGYTINRFVDGAKPFGNGAGHEYVSELVPSRMMPVYECEENCPIREVDEQADEKASRYFLNLSCEEDELFGPAFVFSRKALTERHVGLEDKNTHPTVKPLKLMRYLVKMVLPPGGIVLDPFVGSGSTAIAAGLEGFSCVGIDSSDEYIDLATSRIKHWLADWSWEDDVGYAADDIDIPMDNSKIESIAADDFCY